MKRLSKVLAAAGVASRRTAEKMVFEGKISVNGTVVRAPQTLVSFDKDQITFDGRPILREQSKVYFLLNKPKGYICSNARVGSKKLVTDLFKEMDCRLFTVGRLDRDTTGLLLVTNDGLFAQKVIHPSNNLTKEYLIKTEQEITHEHLLSLSKGVFIEKILVRPVKVSKVRRGTLKIVIREGKKREIRLIAEYAGLNIISLQRIRIGALTLGSLKLGEHRQLKETEISELLQRSG